MLGNRPAGWIRGVVNATSSTQSQEESRPLGLALLRLAECASAVADGDKLWVDISGVAGMPKEAPAPTDASHLHFVQPLAPSWWPEDVAPGLPRVEFKFPFASCTS